VRFGGVELRLRGPALLPARLNLSGIVALLALRFGTGFGRDQNIGFFGVFCGRHD